jgi:hypothetical protein
MQKEEMIKVDNKGRVEKAEVIAAAEMDEVWSWHTLQRPAITICPVSALYDICDSVVCCAYICAKVACNIRNE